MGLREESAAAMCRHVLTRNTHVQICCWTSKSLAASLASRAHTTSTSFAQGVVCISVMFVRYW